MKNGGKNNNEDDLKKLKMKTTSKKIKNEDDLKKIKNEDDHIKR